MSPHKGDTDEPALQEYFPNHPAWVEGGASDLRQVSTAQFARCIVCLHVITLQGAPAFRVMLRQQ